MEKVIVRIYVNNENLKRCLFDALVLKEEATKIIKFYLDNMFEEKYDRRFCFVEVKSEDEEHLFTYINGKIV
jgi:hypothetical protein